MSPSIFQQTQEAGNDLSICMVNLLPKVITLLRSVAIGLVKVEINIFQNVA